MALGRSLSPHSGSYMAGMVKRSLGPTSTGSSSSPDPSYLDPQESNRNYKITAFLNAKNWMGNIVTRVVLPFDTDDSQKHREREWFRQSAMPWGNQNMVTPTDQARLNNNSQAAFVKQRQLAPPNTYGQFYAFMHALSAAFGNLGAGK